VTVRVAVGVTRLVFALVCVIALVSRFLWGLGSATFTASNFFAYLTMQSNIAFVLVSVVAGVVALRGPWDPRWLSIIRSIVLSCTLVAGIVFALIVQQAGARDFPIDVPWSDQVLHFWLPALALIEWIVSPGRVRAPWRILAPLIGYPVVWGVITLVRGASVGWYPYFFLDPVQVTDPLEFVLYSGIALTVFGIVGCGVVALSARRPVGERLWRRRLSSRRGPASAAASR
jgi:hypothetical protein